MPASGTKPSQKITPHLWFDDQAEEAAQFYTSLFDDSSIGRVSRYSDAGKEIHGRDAGTVMTVDFQLAGQSFAALNGGPHFTFTPAISFSVVCDAESELDELWRRLSDGGAALMELGQYDWSEKYGWVRDRYGLTWQLSLGNVGEVGQKITPSLMYVSEKGQAEEAMSLYTSLFDDSEILETHRYGADGDQPEGAVMYAGFQLNGERFSAMDSSPRQADFTFNEAVSLLVNCDTQAEIDHFWAGLSQGGDEGAKQCGWLKDRFGVSWQVVPTALMNEMLTGADADASRRVMQAVLQMKKLDIEELRAAYR